MDAARLDSLLLRERLRAAELLSFVHASCSPALQTAAVRILHALAQRNERLAFAIDAATAQRLRADVAAALRAGLIDALSAQPGAPLPPSCAAALAVQRLLLDTLHARPGVSLAHLLLGFEESDAPSLGLEPASAPASLAVLLECAAALPACALAERPACALGAMERSLQILSLLAASRRTAAATLGRVRAALPLPALLATVAAPAQGLEPACQTAQLQLTAWTLRLTAQLLHDSPLALQRPADADAALLRGLLEPREEGAVPRTLLALLDHARWSEAAPQPSSGVAQQLCGLGLAAVLSPDGASQAGAPLACLRRDERGMALLDVAGLDRLLRDALQAAGTPPDAAFGSAVLQFALRWNDWKREEAASFQLLQAWSELLSLLVTQRFAALSAALAEEPAGRTGALAELLFAALELLPESSDARCASLLRAAHLLLDRLQAATGDGWQGADAQLAPSSCHSVLRLLLSALLRSDRSEETRQHAFAALLSYARLCGASEAASLVSESRGALQSGDDGELRRELDAGNLAELRRVSGPLCAVLSRDALGGSEQGRAQSLALLQALLSLADGVGAALESALSLCGLLPAVASAAERTPASSLLQPAGACLRSLEGLEAQLCFLLACARSLPSGPADLLACAAVAHLAGCAVLSAMPEQCSAPFGAVCRHALRPALQLVAALLGALPDSGELRAQATAFCEAHCGQLLRLLDGVREVGEEESAATQAPLLLLLCSLCARRDSSPSAAMTRLRDALLRSARHFFRLELAAAEGRTALRLHVLRCQSTLAGYVRCLVLSRRASLAPSDAGAADLPSLPLCAQLLWELSAALLAALRLRHELGASLMRPQHVAPGGTERQSALLQLADAETSARLALLAVENCLEAVHSSLPCAGAGEHLRYTLAPVLDDLLATAQAGEEICGRSTAFLLVLLRRTGEQLYALRS